MAVVSGKDGAVTFAAGYAVKVVSWTVDCSAEEVDITALGEAWKTALGGVKSWSGTYVARMDDTSLTATDVGSSAVFGLGQPSASADFTFGNDKLTGSIIITGVSSTLATESGAGEFSFTFIGDGALSAAAS
jgi:hypothetical protein